MAGDEATTTSGRASASAGGAEPVDVAGRRRRACPADPARPIGGQHDPPARPTVGAQGRRQQHVEGRRGGVGRALQLEQHRRRRRGGRRPGRRASPARRGRRRAPRRCAARWRGGGSARTAPGRRRPSAVAPEVEQPAGDDVALDLGAAAVDRGGPRVEELGAPPLAGRVVAERHLGGQRRRPPGRTPPARPWPPAPCRSRSPGPRCSPAASRCWVARDRARKAYSSWVTSPSRAGSRRAGRRGVEQLLEPPVEVGGPVPQRRAALEGQQVHGHRPALALVAQRAVERARRRRRRRPRRTRARRAWSRSGAR